jgi:hypothetical protein
MRSKLFLAGVTFAIGCGGGGGKKAVIVDGSVDTPTIDGPAACAVACDNTAFCNGANLNTGNFPALRIGDKMNNKPAGSPPDTTDWFLTFDANAGMLAGRKALDVGGSVTAGGNIRDILIFRLLKPMNGAFPLNAPTTFDPNPNTEVPAAWSFWLGDAEISGTSIVSVGATYWANTGSITLTSVGEADGATIEGSTAPVTWREIDDQGADVPGGCTASMGMGMQSGFSFFLLQTNDPAPFQDGQEQQPAIDGFRPLTAMELKAAQKYIDEHFSHLWAQQ